MNCTEIVFIKGRVFPKFVKPLVGSLKGKLCRVRDVETRHGYFVFKFNGESVECYSFDCVVA